MATTYGVVMPAMLRSRMKPRMSSLSVFAHTTNTSATCHVAHAWHNPRMLSL